MVAVDDPLQRAAARNRIPLRLGRNARQRRTRGAVGRASVRAFVISLKLVVKDATSNPETVD